MLSLSEGYHLQSISSRVVDIKRFEVFRRMRYSFSTALNINSVVQDKESSGSALQAS
jgi:hypothetical protein